MMGHGRGPNAGRLGAVFCSSTVNDVFPPRGAADCASLAFISECGVSGVKADAGALFPFRISDAVAGELEIDSAALPANSEVRLMCDFIPPSLTMSLTPILPYCLLCLLLCNTHIY